MSFAPPASSDSHLSSRMTLAMSVAPMSRLATMANDAGACAGQNHQGLVDIKR